MAIIIPSKNIYAINNQKVKDNVIDKATVGTTLVNADNEYNVTVYNKSSSGEAFQSDYLIEKDTKYTDFYQYRDSNNVGLHDISVGYVEIYARYGNGGQIIFPVLQENGFIEKVFYGNNQEGKPNVKYSVLGIKKYGSCTANANTTTETIADFTKTSETESDEFYFDFDNDEDLKLSVKALGAEVELTNKSTISSSVPRQINVGGIDYYFIDIDFLVGVKKISMDFRIENSGDYMSTVPIEGTYLEYIPEVLEVTIYGNTIGIKLEDGTVTYGSGNRPFSLSGNELIQDGATTGDILLTKHLANNVLSQYAKGKETAVIRCSISDYYDESGKKVIDTKSGRMSFHLHDKVIPMVYGYDGKDRPMSKYQNGNGKVFEVVGSNIFYDGAVWQELTLQEVSQTQ